MWRLSSFVFMCLALSSVCFAEISIKASVDKAKIYMDQQTRYTLTVSGNVGHISEPILPVFSGFTVYSARPSKSISVINGVMHMESRYVYTLAPDAPGVHRISPATVVVNGQRFRSNPLDVEVLSGSRPASKVSVPINSRKPSSPSASNPVQEEVEEQNLFVVTEVDKDEVYFGEQVILSFKFFHRVSIRGTVNYVEAQTEGFWKEQLLPEQKKYRQNVNGRTFEVLEINYALFPVRSGELTISPASITCTYVDHRRRARIPDDIMSFLSRDISDPFGRNVTKTLNSKPINVMVKPLPPASNLKHFQGAIGEYELKAFSEQKEVRVGEALNIQIELTGVGNMQNIALPEIPQIDGAKIYTAEAASSEVVREGDAISGKNMYELVVLPQRQGTLVIPAIKMHYFDPNDGRYKLAQTDILRFDVKPSLNQSSNEEQGKVIDFSERQDSSGVLNKSQVVLNKDIRFLKDLDENSSQAYDSGLPQWFFVSALVLPPCFAFFLWFLLFLRNREQSDLSALRSRKAYRLAMSKLKLAQKNIKDSDYQAFYNALSAALNEYIADRMDVSSQGLTSVQLEQMLKDRGVDAQLIEVAHELLGKADYARFAATDSLNADQCRKDQQATQKLLSRLEKVL